MREGPRLRGLPVFGFAVAGLLIGHALSYAIAVPDPYHRDLVLDRTGHGYLPVFAEGALIFVLAGLAAAVARALTAGRAGITERFSDLARLLIGIQVAAFVGQEVLERLVAGAPLGGLAHDHLLSIGLVVQVGVALAAAWLLRVLARVSSRFAEVIAPTSQPPRVGSMPAVPILRSLFPRFMLVSAASVRGPPAR